VRLSLASHHLGIHHEAGDAAIAVREGVYLGHQEQNEDRAIATAR
jgi:hypothetical protein